MAHLINDRWLRIPEEAIYRLFIGLGNNWRPYPVMVAGDTRYYLVCLPYAYPYSLPLTVIERLANQLNGGFFMLDHASWYTEMLTHPGYNDTAGQVVVESRLGSTWMVLGVHKLTKEEAPSYPTVFFDIRCKTTNRDGMKPAYFSWIGMQPHETPHPIFADKLLHEVPALAIMPTMVISMWLDDSDLVRGFKRDDSYFVIFQERVAFDQIVEAKELVLVASAATLNISHPVDHATSGLITLEIDKDFLNSLPVNEYNRVKLIVPVYR